MEVAAAPKLQSAYKFAIARNSPIKHDPDKFAYIRLHNNKIKNGISTAPHYKLPHPFSSPLNKHPPIKVQKLKCTTLNTK